MFVKRLSAHGLDMVLGVECTGLLLRVWVHVMPTLNGIQGFHAYVAPACASRDMKDVQE